MIPLNVIAGYIDQVLKVFQIPGLSLVIVKDGKVLYNIVSGTRRFGTYESVTRKTLFHLGSNTKLMTAVALALLVEEGLVQWDDPIRKHLPWFALRDKVATEGLTIRQALAHLSGLAAYGCDLLWFPPTILNRKKIVFQLRYADLVGVTGKDYAYDNVMYLVLAELIEAVTGQTWEQFVLERVLLPLGMHDTVVDHETARLHPDISQPHAIINNEVTLAAYLLDRNNNPAGGAAMPSLDMERWLLFLTNGGQLANGPRLLQRATLDEIFRPYASMPAIHVPGQLGGLLNTGKDERHYGLGIETRTQRGHEILTHGGCVSGQVSRIVIVPNMQLGIAAMSNLEHEGINALAYLVLDWFLRLPEADWITAWKELLDTPPEDSASISPVVQSQPYTQCAAFTGMYYDRCYEHIDIVMVDDKLHLQFRNSPLLTGTLLPINSTQFVVQWHHQLHVSVKVTFTHRPDGSIAHFAMEAQDGADPSYVFHEIEAHKIY